MRVFLSQIRSVLAAGLFALAGPAGAEVHFVAPGADGPLLENLKAHLPLASESCDAPRWRVRRLLKRAPETLDPALRAFGYYDSRIVTTLDDRDDCWLAEIQVTLGPVVTVRGLELDIVGAGAGSEPFESIRRAPGIRPGEPLRHDRYEALKSALAGTALEFGYFDARFEQRELRVDAAAGRADIRLRYDTGPRYRVGTLKLSEQPLDEAFIRRLGALKPGAPYAARDLAALDRHLTDSGYFASVEVMPRREQAVSNAVPVDVRLAAMKRHAWRFGVGYETDIGPRLSLRYDNRFVNRHGHKFESELRLSPVESELTGSYTVPGKDPHKETFVFGGGARHEDTDGTRIDSTELSARQVLRRVSWTKTHYLRLLQERSEVGGQTIDATLLLPGVSWSRVRSDDPLRTSRGYRLDFDLSAAHDSLLSTTSVLRVKAGAKGIHRFPGFGRVSGRIDLGAAVSSDFDDLPSSLRFYAGGDNSVRGYAYKSLSPRDAANEPIGGRYLVTGSLEYEHPLGAAENWWGAVFADAGNAFDDDGPDLQFGYGVGLRWYSPIGRVRLDLAFPEDTSEDDFRLHLGIGVDL